MGEQVLTSAQLAELSTLGMDKSTPLWYYILKEAQVLEGGLQMGPVSGRIIGEVFIGLTRADKDFCLTVNRNWKPTLLSAKTGDFKSPIR